MLKLILWFKLLHYFYVLLTNKGQGESSKRSWMFLLAELRFLSTIISRLISQCQGRPTTHMKSEAAFKNGISVLLSPSRSL